MTTQNVSTQRETFSNLTPTATSFYYPSANGYVDMAGFDHLEIRFRLVSNDVNNTLTLTVESDDGVTNTFEWDETMGCWNWNTGTYGTVSFVATNTTTRGRLLLQNANSARIRVRVYVVLAAAAANSGVVEFRKIKE